MLTATHTHSGPATCFLRNWGEPDPAYLYRCRPGGWIKCEILRRIPSRVHPDVDPVAGLTFAESDPLTGDSLDQVVTWKGDSDLSEAGEMLAIRLRMFRARLFAYRV